MSARIFSGAEKMKARCQLGVAVLDGRVAKATNCERCGVNGAKWKRGLHGHHEDYAKPLEAMWLCPPCHAARHIEIGRQPSGGKSGRNRCVVSFTPRPDLYAWAIAYFPHTKFRSLSRFVDHILLKHARLKKAALAELGIPLPKDEVTV